MKIEAITRAYDARVDVAEGERSVVAAVNTAAVDRYRTVILPRGIDLTEYRKNPVVLWEHGQSPQRGSLPIGRAAWIKLDKATDQVIAKTMFGPEDDEFADRVFRMYQDGTLKGFSVNVLPDLASASAPTSAELRARPDLAECRTVYRKSKLCEFSGVSVPGNQEALALAVSRGLWVPDELRAGLPSAPPAAPELPALVGRSFGAVHRSLLAKVRAQRPDAGAITRDTLDLLRGRV